MNETSEKTRSDSTAISSEPARMNQIFPKEKLKRFPGTVSYEDNEISRKLFFGRDEEAKRLLHLILAETLVVLFAKSGNGKTSLLQAKVFKKLRDRNFMPVVVRLNKKEYSPEQIIKNELSGINDHVNYEVLTGKLENPDDLIEYLQKTEIWSTDDKLFTPVLVLDQFEEIYTFEHNTVYRKDFFRLLAAMLKARKEGLLNIKIVIAIREDFLGYLKKLTDIVPTAYSNLFRLEGLSRDSIDDVIKMPAGIQLEGIEFASEKFYFSDEALKQLKQFLCLRKEEGEWKETEEVEPIQLQIICSELEERVIREEIPATDGKIIIQADDLGGEKGLKEILGKYYEKQLGKLKTKLKLGANEITAIRNIIEKELIAGNKRVPLAYDSIISREGIRKEAIDLLIAAKLLRVEERGLNSLVEICHDTLVEPISASCEAREKEERDLKRNKSVLLIASLIIVAIGGILIYFFYQQILSQKKLTKSMQEKALTVSIATAKQNPTLALKIASYGLQLDSTHPGLLAQIQEFDNEKYSFITNRIKAKGSIIFADLLTNSSYYIADEKSIYKWSNNILDTSFNHTGIVIGSGKVKDNIYFIINKQSDTAEVRDQNNHLITKFIINPLSYQASVSPNGKYYVIGDSLYRAGKMRSIRYFPLWGNLFGAVKTLFTKDSKYIISAHTASYIFIHDTIGNFVASATHDYHAAAEAIAFSDDLSMLVSACRTPLLKSWKVNNLSQATDEINIAYIDQPDMQHTARINCIAISPDNKYILTGSDDNTAILWNWKWERLSILRGHTSRITYVGFTQNGNQMITGDADGFILTWEKGNAIELNKKEKLVKLSPFDFRAVGLSGDEYSFGELYDTSTFNNSIASLLDYIYSMPTINAYPESTPYRQSLQTSVEELESLYSKMLSDKRFISTSPVLRNYLTYYYGIFSLNKYKLLSNKKETEKEKNERLGAYYDSRAKETLIDTVDLTTALFIAEQYTFISIYFQDSAKQSDKALLYVQKNIDLLKAFYKKFPDDENLRTQLSVSYGRHAWYALFNRNYKLAIESAGIGLALDSLYQEWINTNLALGYLLDGQHDKANAIYTRYMKPEHNENGKNFTESFLQDFKDLEKAGIITKTNPDMYEQVEELRYRMRNAAKTSPR